MSLTVSRWAAWSVALGLLLAGLAARAEQELPVYPGTVHTRIGNDLIIAGEYYRMAYFTTEDSLEKVARYFVKHWRTQGYPTVVDGDLKTEAVVSALYTREGLQRGVVLRRHMGKTVGFTVLRDLWVRVKKTPPRALLSLEGTLYSQDLVTRDEPGNSQNRTSLVTGSLDSVRRQVVAQLGHEGYQPVRESQIVMEGTPRLTLEYARPGEQVVTTLSPVDGQTTAVLQMWIGSDRPDAVPNDEALRQGKLARQKQKVKP
jgi:hypothetical protein